MKTKILNFELIKRLTELGLLDNIETEYLYIEFIDGNGTRKIELFKNNNDKAPNDIRQYKAIMLDDVIEILIENNFSIKYWKNHKLFGQGTRYEVYIQKIDMYSHGNTLLEATEEMLKYLLDKKLLGKQK